MSNATYTTTPPTTSPKPLKAKKLKDGPGPSKPMYQMVMEAFKENKKAKGLSLPAVKNYITTKYPETQENFSSARLRKAIEKGLNTEEIVRHAKSDETAGFKGFFVLNKTAMAEKEKILKKKATEKAKAAKKKATETAVKAAKPKKVVKKTDPAKAKSPKPKKTDPSPKPSKSPKSPKTKVIGKASKKPLKESTNKASASKVAKKSTPKKIKAATTGTPMAKKVATPKTSKAATAGLKKKTAAVKKIAKKTA